MGISYFETFLKLNAGQQILRTEYLCDQYIVLDGSEILYELYFECDSYGRGNYVTFQSTIKQFFENLRKCGITAVVLFDGFKLEDNQQRYVERRFNKIQIMKQMFDSGEVNPKSKIKPCLCELVFAQVLEELNILSVTGIGDMDESKATIANILKAPVVASDTIFCTFRLEKGMVPLFAFEWKEIKKNATGKECIKVRTFHQHQLSRYFNMDENAIPFILLFYPNVSWIDRDTFRFFRERNFEGLPLEGKLEKALLWLAYNYKRNDEQGLVQYIVNHLPLYQRHQMETKIKTYLQSRRNPRGQEKVLDVIRERIDDPIIGALFQSPEIRRKEEHNPLVKHIGLEDLVDDASSLSFPAWAIRMILAQAVGGDAINYLPLALTDPGVYPSPHKTTYYIRVRSYKALVPSNDDEKVFLEFDRIGETYSQVGHLVVPINISLGPHGRAFDRVKDEETMKRRRKYLLDTLIPPEKTEVRARYDVTFAVLSDDLKLPVATTFHWVSKAHPDLTAIDALVFQLVICQSLVSMDQLHEIVHEMEKDLEMSEKNHWCPDSQALHWSSEWQSCLWEAINLNQILGFPLPEPDVAKVFESLLFERACSCFLAGHAALYYIQRSDDRHLFREICSLLKEG